MNTKKPKSTGLIIEGDSRDNTFTNIKISGFDEGVVVREKNGKSPSGNKFIDFKVKLYPKVRPLVTAIKKPFAKLSATLFITIVGGLIVAAITVFYFQPWQENIQEQLPDKKPEISLQKV